jgi:biopolymer transport protein TolQ
MELFAAVPAVIGRSLPQILADAGRFGLTILMITFVLSVMTWAVVWDRARLYRKLRSRGEALRRAIGTRGMSACLGDAEKYLPSIEASILLETQRFVTARGGNPVLTFEDAAEAEAERSHLKGLLEGRALNEIGEMERHLILLSTTSSGAPFLGLLGTVWGIMHSFMSMGVEGAASLEVVGPGIAEALVTTIAGLGSAIPALVAYNAFVRVVHRKETQIDLFISRVIDSVVLLRSGSQRTLNSPRPARAGAAPWSTTTP